MAVRRPHLFIMRQSAGERAELLELARRRGMTGADLLRSLVKNDARYAFAWVEHPCEKCGEHFAFRRDVPPPYLCPRHESPRAALRGPKLAKGSR